MPAIHVSVTGAVVLAALWAAPAGAQVREQADTIAASPGSGTAAIAGRALDAKSKKPVAGAAIYLNRNLQDGQTQKDGSFTINAEGPGEVIVRRPGYVPLAVMVERGTAALGDLLLRQVRNDADEAAVQEMDIRIYPQLRAFYERRAKYRRGAFWTPDDLQRSGGTIPDMLRARPGFRNICVVNRHGDWDCGKADRGPNTIMGSGRSGFAEQNECTVRVWTDDLGPEQTLDEIRVTDLLAIEAYPTPTDTPDGFGASRCATVRVWTKRAAQR